MTLFIRILRLGLSYFFPDKKVIPLVLRSLEMLFATQEFRAAKLTDAQQKVLLKDSPPRLARDRREAVETTLRLMIETVLAGGRIKGLTIQPPDFPRLDKATLAIVKQTATQLDSVVKSVLKQLPLQERAAPIINRLTVIVTVDDQQQLADREALLASIKKHANPRTHRSLAAALEYELSSANSQNAYRRIITKSDVHQAE